MTLTPEAPDTDFTVPLLQQRSYDAYVAGRDVPGIAWCHTLHAHALIGAPHAALTMLDELNTAQGLAEPLPTHPWVVGRTALVDLTTVDAALRAAGTAAPDWAATSQDTRLGILDGFCEALDTHAAEFEQLSAAEGHPLRTARWELEGMKSHLHPSSLEWLRDQLWYEEHVETSRVVLRRQPDGVVAIIPPANAPAPIAAIAAIAIAVGNTTVVRVPRSNPLTAMWLLREVLAPIVEAAGAPPGTLNVICADPAESLDRMILAEETSTMVYFGQTARGRSVQRRCADHGVKPVLELAGNDTLVVWDDADLDAAAQACTEAVAASGQICMLPNRIIAHPTIADGLLERILTRVDQLTPGFPDDEDTVLAAVKQQDGYLHALEECRTTSSVTLLRGGTKRDVHGNPDDTMGLFVDPAVARIDGLATAETMRVVTDETFYPLIPVIVPETSELDRVLDFVNNNHYGLRNSLWTNNTSLIDEWLRRCTNGGLLQINSPHTAAPPALAPTNGGTGLSNGGNAYGAQNFGLELTHLQGVHIPAPGADTRFRTPLG
ncbi:aldehyde dehydrogenase family protein [Saccharopolyspora griseoalba]|uniref:Aldehyde dehydrogenase family protein n=1 Tax=Saccharopolyspora griseoalba TaxID=1431848 RepID=A0ABW2LPS9_9PSEU